MDDQAPTTTLPPGPSVRLVAGCVNITRDPAARTANPAGIDGSHRPYLFDKIEGHRTRTQVVMDSKSFVSVVLGTSTDPILPTEVVPVVMSANHTIKIESTVVHKRIDMCKFLVIGRVILFKGESSEY